MDTSESILLSGSDWRIRQDENGRLDWVKGCVPATVPGNIQGDLQDACLLKPLDYGLGDDKLFSVCLTGWWYEKEFDLPAGKESCRKTLVFDGIDYSGDVYVNGERVGRAEGQFVRHFFDVTPFVRTGKNTLAVHIDPMPEELSDWLRLSDGKQSGEGTPYHFVLANDRIRQVLKGLKSPATCSYDWGTNIYALGIWKDVHLEFTDTARIDWMQIKPRLCGGFDAGSVSVTLETDSLSEIEAELCVTVEGPGAPLSVAKPVVVPKGKGEVSLSLSVDSPALWWPNGYGEQPLYTVTAVLKKDGRPLAQKKDRMGFRSVEWEMTEGAPESFPDKFGLVINGKRVRTMGSCLTSTELLPGRIGGRARHFAEMAKACNMTALRQHGGQVIFPEEMYRACDELGMLLLVDFPLGNCIPENDPALLKNLDATIASIVKQLRNHPSIVEWSGGNELNTTFVPDADRTGLETIRAAAAREDDTRVFRDTCPIKGSRHAPWDYIPSRHYEYYNSDLKDNFGDCPMMRYGEFGCQTPANIEVWLRDIPAASRWPLNPEDPVLIRKNVFYAVFSPEYWLLPRITEEVFGPLSDLEMTIYGGQYLAAEGIRYAMDAQRAMGRRLGGFTSWDYNEPWPNGAGSFLVDYDGCPVMMYYYAKQALEPIALSLKYDSLYYKFFRDSFAELRLVSDAPERVTGLRCEWVCRDRLGRAYQSGSCQADIDPLEVKTLGSIRINPPENMAYGPVLVELCLRSADGGILAERLYLFGAEGVNAPLRSLLKPEDTTTYEWGVPYALTGMAGGRLSRAQLRVEAVSFGQEDGWETLCADIANDSDMTALLVELSPVLAYRNDLIIENNFIHIPPRQTRRIKVRAKAGAGLSLAQTGWRVRCRNAGNVEIEPDKTVLFAVGRLDKTCREFSRDTTLREAKAEGRMLSPERVFHLLEDEQRFVFDIASPVDATVRICAADRSSDGAQGVVSVNGTDIPFCAGAGLGAQKTDPEQLAYPKTQELFVPASAFAPGENTVCIKMERGWLTWDALQIVAAKSGK